MNEYMRALNISCRTAFLGRPGLLSLITLSHLCLCLVFCHTSLQNAFCLLSKPPTFLMSWAHGPRERERALERARAAFTNSIHMCKEGSKLMSRLEQDAHGQPTPLASLRGRLAGLACMCVQQCDRYACMLQPCRRPAS